MPTKILKRVVCSLLVSGRGLAGLHSLTMVRGALQIVHLRQEVSVRGLEHVRHYNRVHVTRVPRLQAVQAVHH